MDVADMDVAEALANVEMAAAWDGEEGDDWTEHAERYEAAGEAADDAHPSHECPGVVRVAPEVDRLVDRCQLDAREAGRLEDLADP